MIDFVTHNMAPLMFAGMMLFMVIGYPASFSLAAVGLFFGFIGIELGLIRTGFSRQPDVPAFRHRFQRPAACDSVLHADGNDPRAMRACRGSARRIRPVVRAGARRTLVCGDPGRRGARRHHRNRRGLGHRHGHHLAAGDDALRLFGAPHHRRDRGIGHHHAAHPAVARAGGARRPARQVGRRHVSRRDRPELHPGRAVCGLCAAADLYPSAGRSGAAAGGAHACAAGRWSTAASAAWCRRSS